MGKCQKCHKPLKEGVKFCLSCGAAVEPKGGKKVIAKQSTPSGSPPQDITPKGEGLGKALTTITSPKQKFRYIITGVILSAFGFFVASIPLGTATLVVGRILLRNKIKVWGYLFCLIGTVWAVGLPLLNFLALIDPKAGISIIPKLPTFKGT